MSEPAPTIVPAAIPKKMVCGSCGKDCDPNADFCPNCGSRPDKKLARTDFEIGRIDALETVKADILKWLGIWAVLITLALALLVYVGVDHIITDKVGTEVQQKLASMTSTIDAATDKAYTSGAKAEIQTEDAQKKIEVLDAKMTELESTIRDLNQRKSVLEASIIDLDKEKGKLANSLSDTEHKATELNNIIKGQNLVQDFALLRYDMYRMREATATVLLAFPPGSYPQLATQNLDILPHMISYEKSTPGKPSDMAGGLEFMPTLQATTFSNPQGPVTSVMETYRLFAPFEEGLPDRLIESLNRIRTLRLFWGPNNGTFTSSDEALKAFDAAIKTIKEVDIELRLNGIPLTVHKLPDLAAQAAANREAVNIQGSWFVEVTADVSKDFTDVKKLYDTKLAPPPQPTTVHQ